MLRVLSFLIVLSGVLSGCDMPPPPPAAQTSTAPARIQSPQPDMPPTGVTLAEPSAVLPPVASAPVAAPLPPPDPPMLAQQRAGCARIGGTLIERAAGVRSCVTPTRDGGQRCNAASACEGICLARSGTCAPFQPLFGCQEVFTLPGRRETLCLE